MNALPQSQPKLESREPAIDTFGNGQTMETIGRLLSGVAHDFNNLLTGVVLCSDLLLAGLEKQSGLRHYAQEIRLAAAHGTDLIQQLLAVGRPGGVTDGWISLNEVVASLRNLLTRLLREDIELVTDLAVDLGMVRMNPAQCQQIILNLVLNARDAMPHGGSIQLSTRNCGPENLSQSDSSLSAHVELEVRDNGYGMDADTRGQAFQPFFTTKKPGFGSGLGLATVLAIVQQSGGSVVVYSETGKGARVVVRLPAPCPSPTPGVGGKRGAVAATDPQIERRGKQV